MYYAAHNNTKYDLIASYLIGKIQITEPVRKYNKTWWILKKNKNESGTKLINWDSSGPSKWIYFAKKIRRYSSA